MMPLAAITDEFSPDLDLALPAMASVGMTGAELRVVGAKNLIQCSDDEVDAIRAKVEQHGLRVISIASPVLKCVLPDAPPVDTRFQQDVFGSSFTMADQPRLEERALQIAERSGARIVRVFSYWRSIDPAACFDRVCGALRRLATAAAERGIIIGIENEPACNIATGAETAAVLAAVNHPSLQVIWDPANALVAGERPFPDGYAALPAARIVHVHAKDCTVSGQTPTWGAVGEMDVDWKGQLAALVRDGYAGWLSLETHWKGPNGDKMEASTICGRNMQSLTRDL
jgi:L-ribulose-5-phosphate 3-epimerase